MTPLLLHQEGLDNILLTEAWVKELVFLKNSLMVVLHRLKMVMGNATIGMNSLE